MYGVIVCGRCNRAKGVDLSSATTTCPGCGRTIRVERAKVYFRTDDLRELAEGVRQVTERTRDLSPPSEVIVPPGERVAPIHRPRVRDLESIIEVMRGLEEFSEDDLVQALGMDRDEAGEVIARMLCQGDLMEPRSGRYRLS